MSDLAERAAIKPDVPEEMQTRWQRFVNLLSGILGVPAAVIMRVDLTQIEVFLSSATEGNPFQRGARLQFDTNLFCEKVIRERTPLLVTDGSNEPEWRHSPGVGLGLTYFHGYPISWPDNEIFGTICIFDRKDNEHATRFQALLSEFREFIEKDLRTLIELGERDNLLAELQVYRDHADKIIAERTAELEKSREALEERLRFEDLISELSARSIKVPLERVDAEIIQALNQICRFFGAGHCGILEVRADRRQIHFVISNYTAEERPGLMKINMAPGHPWAYHRLVEQAEPVIFSSLDDLPPEACVDRTSWEQERTHALFVLPLRVSEQVTHLISLSSPHSGHKWPVAHMRRLRVLGESFAKVLIHWRAQEALRRHERRLTEAQRIARLGSWEWDVGTGDLQWSDEVYRLFGRRPREFAATYEAFLAAVHPDDRQGVKEAVKKSLADPDVTYSIEHRVVCPDGAERVVHERGEVIFDQEHRPVRMIGTVQDITDRIRGEEALQKAFDEINQLKELLEAENIYLRKEITLKEGFTRIIGASAPIKRVMNRIRQVAPTRTTVLLTGETGTGKGLFACALHEASDRRDKPFVNVNCAGLPPNLIESELFGREKGAFTGSTARQIGRFELANGGTIFLDEIGELPLELQAKLLKVIEDGEFERLGSPRTVKVDVRIITSTNRHLEEETRKSRFRKDLFYRLNVFPVNIPPLRQRREDIPALAQYYADRFCKRHGKAIRKIPENTMKILANYDWPGNVRELMNVIERAVILSDGPDLRIAEQIEVQPVGPDRENVTQDMEARETKDLVDIEREHILKTLHKAGWRIEGDKGAARLLGLNPSTMRARMRKLGIKRPKLPSHHA